MERRIPDASGRVRRHLAQAPHGLWISPQRILMVAVTALCAAAPDLGAAMFVAPDFAVVASQCGANPRLAVGPWC
jgi:cell division protein FtsW (lipid II flippase)